jgi:DNA polymerase III subunit delta
MPVMVLAGEEEFEISRRVAELKSKLLDPNWETMNFTRLKNPPLSDIVELAASLPFGFGNRMILIDQCELFTKKRTKGDAIEGTPAKSLAKRPGKDKESTDLDSFEESLSSISPNTYLIFACLANFDSSLKISKSAAKHAQLESFPREKYFPGSRSPKLETWCRKEAHRYSVTIDDDAIQYLLEACEANLRQVSSEINKAAVALLPKTHISKNVVEKLSPHHSHVFEFADRWLANQNAEALLSLEELLTQQSGMPILAALQTFLSKWIKIKLLSESYNEEVHTVLGSNRKELPLADLSRRIAAELKLIPFVVERDLRKLSKWTSKKLIAKRIELSRLEYLIKTGQMPEKHALELFLVG